MAEVQQLNEEQTLLKRVVQTSLHRSLLAKGVHEVCKAIEGKKPKFVVLAEDVTEASYKKLIIALAKENNIPVWKIDKGEILGDWIGISKYLNKAKKVKSRKCSSLAVIDFAIDIGEGEKKLIEDKVKAL
ncbi:hypothetical protein pb186bvf_009890 [Paramecium bursaria]